MGEGGEWWGSGDVFGDDFDDVLELVGPPDPEDEDEDGDGDGDEDEDEGGDDGEADEEDNNNDNSSSSSNGEGGAKDKASKRGGNLLRVGIYLDSVKRSGTARAPHVGPQHVQRAKRSRTDRRRLRHRPLFQATAAGNGNSKGAVTGMGVVKQPTEATAAGNSKGAATGTGTGVVKQPTEVDRAEYLDALADRWAALRRTGLLIT